MAVHRRGPGWLVVLGAAGLIGCGHHPNPLEPALDPAPFPQPCRTYATAWTTSEPGGPASSSADFNPTSLVYEIYSPAGSSRTVRRQLYSSQDDFVDEPTVLGRRLFTRRESCATNACSGGLALVDLPSFEAGRRLLSVRTILSGITLTVETYADWDTQDRPTAGILCLGVYYLTA